MPVFDTPEPISVTLEIGVGDVQITAEDRTDTIVEVQPTDGTDGSDMKASGRASVEYDNGVLTIRTPKPRTIDFSRKTRSVDVTIVLPAGSHVRGKASVGDLRCSGRLGECRFRTSVGHVELDHIGPLHLGTAGGHITVGRVDGDAEISTATGRIRIGEIDGAAAVKNSNGSTEIGRVTGDLHVRGTNGDICVDRPSGLKTDAETANGSIRVSEVTCGAVVLKTSSGDLEVGIGAGRPARLDLATGYGRVNNTLDGADEAPGESIDVQAHTSYGDITIHRAL
ncbi:DUF4097 family beta strand repeat-containing protein [Streptomyces beigongshangae]|uniref:DUF4097 family beta strand repeat-containing protein n=1 Tax=Streptomyces beigongshangae TaxID=2841597 RepID=UPI001C8492E9|nr:DUF4097 family beta strand repeat-containing protein [Streptomyces sp. REN17]